MKRIQMIIALLPLAGLLVSFGQTAQTGTVVYEEVTQIEIKLEGEMAAMMKDFPKEQKSNMVLYFSPQASLYEKMKTNEEVNMGHTEGAMTIMMHTPDNKLFIDFDNEKIIEQREFMTRNFLITGEFPEDKWKITGEQKMILDYPCMEATKTDTAGVVTRAWFTPSIAVPAGPARFCMLPGLVLEVNIKDGDRIYLAQSVNFDPLEKDTLKKPKDGKKVSEVDFNKIVAEKMKEMGVEGGGVSGGKTMMIKIQH